MRNILIVATIIIVAVIVIFWLINPYVSVGNSVVRLQTLTVLLLIPLVIGTLVGYLLRSIQERKRLPVTKI